VSSVSFNPLTAVYEASQPIPPDTLAAMDTMVDWLREEKARSREPEFIDNSDGFLSLFPRAYRGAPSPLKCFVGYHNLVVDAYGNVYPCTVTYQRGEAVGSVAKQPLDVLWHSDAYQRRREELVGCTDCMWNCHTEINLLYQRPG
jgi:MoaA/NifB/PqqE/SkfB family radical SAM enzyme